MIMKKLNLILDTKRNKEENLNSVLNYIYIDVKTNRMVATDTFLLVSMKLNKYFEEDFLNTLPARFLISERDFKQLTKRYVKLEYRKEDKVIKVIRKNRTDFINISFEKEHFLYPRFEHLLNIDDTEITDSSNIRTASVSKLEAFLESEKVTYIDTDEHIKFYNENLEGVVMKENINK